MSTQRTETKTTLSRTLILAATISLVGILAFLGTFGLTPRVAHSRDSEAVLAFEQAAELLAEGHSEAAADAYESAIHAHHPRTDVSKGVEAYLGSFTPSHLRCNPNRNTQVEELISAFDRLPPPLKTTETSDIVVRQLEACVHQIGGGDVAASAASLVLLEEAEDLALAPATKQRVQRSATDLRRRLALALEQDRPTSALEYLVALPDDEDAQRRARAILDSFDEASPLWTEREPAVSAWIRNAESRGRSEDASRVRSRLEAAALLAGEAESAIRTADERELRKMAATGRDERAAIAYATQLLKNGKSGQAAESLRRLGPPGRTSEKAQVLLGQCLVATGDLEAADVVLSTLLQERMPAFRRLQRRTHSAMMGYLRYHRNNAKLGVFPQEIREAIDHAPDHNRAIVFEDWLARTALSLPEVVSLRNEVSRNDVPVQASIELGKVRLARALQVTGASRRAMLEGAVEAFLGVDLVAQDLTVYHSALVVAYHRLGQPDQANAHSDKLLARKDPATDFGLAEILNELGFRERAASILEALVESGSESWRHSAAWELALKAPTQDEKRRWLGRCNQSDAAVQRAILEVQAAQDASDGKCDRAEAAYERVIAAYEEDFHDVTSKNNAAAALRARYACSGKLDHLNESVDLMRQAVSQAPTSTIMTANYAGTLEYAGLVRVLQRFIDASTLRLSTFEARDLVDALLASNLAPSLRSQLASDSHLVKSQELALRHQTLAPSDRDAYPISMRWLSWTRNEHGFRDALGRIESSPSLASDAKEVNDAADLVAVRRELERRVRTSKRRVDRARSAGNGPTLAAALLLYRNVLVRQAIWDPEQEDLDAVLQAGEQAAGAWPEAGFHEDRSRLLVWVGVRRARGDCPAFAGATNADEVDRGTATLLLRVLRSKDGMAVAACLRYRPEILRAAELERSREGEPAVLTHVLGWILSDEVLTRRGIEAFSSAPVLLEARLESALHGSEGVTKARLDQLLAGPLPGVGPSR